MEQVKRRPARQERDEEAADAPQYDAQAQRASEDAACCLAEIDKVLDEEAAHEETERERHERESAVAMALYEEIRARGYHSDFNGSYELELRLWKAEYAHLGLVDCCGRPI